MYMDPYQIKGFGLKGELAKTFMAGLKQYAIYLNYE